MAWPWCGSVQLEREVSTAWEDNVLRQRGRGGRESGMAGVWDGRSLGANGEQEDQDGTGRRETGKWGGTRTQRVLNIKLRNLTFVL